MDKILEKCKNTRILGAVGIVCLVLGVIMPYAKYDIIGFKYSITLWRYWEGKVIMVLAIANLLFIYKDLIEKYVPNLFNSDLGQKIKNCQNAKFSLIPTVLSAIFAIYVTSILGIESFKYYNIGFYAMWLGTLSLVAYAFLHKSIYTSNPVNNTNVNANMNNNVNNNMNSTYNNNVNNNMTNDYNNNVNNNMNNNYNNNVNNNMNNNYNNNVNSNMTNNYNNNIDNNMNNN